jgi:accessory colonization factor AcfC
MRPVRALIVQVATIVIVSMSSAYCAEIKVLTSGGFAPTLEKILPQYQRATGVAVTTSRGASHGSSPNTIGALGAGAIVATTTTATNFISQTTAPLAQAIMEGVILGSTPWPSAPIDAQARLRLASTGCDLSGRCASED